MRAFITGIHGFAGTHLRRLLRSETIEVAGIDRCQDPRPTKAGIESRAMDINDTSALSSYLAQIRPQQVYHLAGVASTAQVKENAQQAWQINAQGTLSLMEAICSAGIECRVVLASSAHVYSRQVLASEAREDSAVEPIDFYGVTKLAAEHVVAYYGTHFPRISTGIARSFNHTGPGQSPSFVCADWARQAAQIACSNDPATITVGDTHQEIDFSDVRDVVRAYYAIMCDAPHGQIYNVCSGATRSLSQILEYFVDKSGKKVQIRTKGSKNRPAKKASRRSGDHTKLRTHTTWEPRIPINTTLDDLFDYWCSRVTSP